MPDPYRRPYLDSSVYIAAIRGEVGRADVAKHILEDAEAGKLQVVGSTFVIAEVIRAKNQPPLSQEDEQIVDQYVMRESMIWVELDVSLALEARRIARAHGLKPADAVHLASAIKGEADVLFRWDDRFIKDGGTIEGINVTEPYWTGQLKLDTGSNG
jgi:predicted nucleic acid-binding protein